LDSVEESNEATLMRHDWKGSEPENGDISTHGQNGHIAIVDTTADSISIVDRMGNVRRSTGIMRDVALRGFRARESHEAAAATPEARAAATTAGRAKSEFLSVMSHELRTPLTSVSGFIDLLSDTQGLSREQSRYLQLAGTASEALLAVIDDILDFSQVDSGRLKLAPRAFSPSALAHDTMAIILPAAAAKGPSVKYAILGDLPQSLIGDQARLRQALLNVLDNAVKFTESGSITVEVSSQPSANDRERIRFYVTDTGIGVPLPVQQRMFEQFSQADNSLSRRHGGTGSGLTIGKGRIELMDGEIRIISDGARGSTLPCEAVAESSFSPAEPSDGKTNPRILVVDDIDINREIIEAYLDLGGFDVDTAASAAEAILMLQARRYDLVLMDIQMPDMDGVTASRCIRSLPDSNRHIPIIAMTGNVLPEQVRGFLAAGMNGHIGKPIERAALYSKVQRWLPKLEAVDMDFADLPSRDVIAHAAAPTRRGAQ
jgi:signal transduction histidine kinase/FixJ family two-component response regulator